MTLNKKKQIDVMCLDLSKAFDCVLHEELVLKLKLIRINTETVKWITAYLRGRTQYVEV